MGNPIVWAVVFLALALILFAIELFIPSGGLIGVAAGACLILFVVMLFLKSPTLGLIGAILCVAALPFGMLVAIRIWPHTPIARYLSIGEASNVAAVASPVGETAGLLHAKGKAITDLRPVGTCLINGRRYECLAESGMIRATRAVEVTSVDGMQVKVREAPV